MIHLLFPSAATYLKCLISLFVPWIVRRQKLVSLEIRILHRECRVQFSVMDGKRFLLSRLALALFAVSTLGIHWWLRRRCLFCHLAWWREIGNWFSDFDFALCREAIDCWNDWGKRSIWGSFIKNVIANVFFSFLIFFAYCFRKRLPLAISKLVFLKVLSEKISKA